MDNDEYIDDKVEQEMPEHFSRSRDPQGLNYSSGRGYGFGRGGVSNSSDDGLSRRSGSDFSYSVDERGGYDNLI